MQAENVKFESWCIVELFGHTKIAGRCSEQNIAGTNFLRVDVPETKIHPAFTRFLGAAAIYSINPVEQGIAELAAGNLGVTPVSVWSIKQLLKSVGLLPSPDGSSDDLPF